MKVVGLLILLININCYSHYRYHYHHHNHYHSRHILSSSSQPSSSQPSSSSSSSSSSSLNAYIDIDELLSLLDDDIFTNKVKNYRPIAGNDITIDLNVNTTATIYGGSENIKIKQMKKCNNCNGYGYIDDDDDSRSRSRSSSSSISDSSSSSGSMFSSSSDSSSMFSSSRDSSSNRDSSSGYCIKCNGKGTITTTKDITINILPGIMNNTIITMYNDGNDGLYGGKNGNLLIKVNIKYDDDSKYQRKGSIDIISDEEIQYYDAILGINKEVDTIHGKLLINIPSGSQHGTQIKINNYGIRIPETKQGDAYINLKIKIPVNVSEEEMTLLTAIQSHRTSINL